MTLLRNSSILLRALEPEDLEILYRWENNTDIWQYGSTLAPFSKFIIREYIAESHRDIYEIHQVRFMIEQTETHTPIGLADLFDFDPHHRRAAVGILIDTPFQCQGFGYMALQSLQEYAFSFLKLHQLYAYIPLENKAYLRLFNKSGFVRHGIFKEWLLTQNGYTDVAMVQKINSDKSL